MKPAALALVAAIVALPAAAGPVAWPEVACHVTYGGETRIVRTDATRHAHDVAPTAIGSYFLFRPVVEVSPAGRPRVQIHTYADREDGPVPIHQATHDAPRPTGRHSQGFTGLQHVYEPVRDGELAYWCEVERLRRRPVLLQSTSPPLRPLPPAGQARGGTVRLLFVGDVMLDDGPGRSIAAGGDPLAPFAAWLAGADYRIGNLELPIAAAGVPLANKIYTFRADPEVLRVLKGRFDAMSVANNHSGDQGRQAFVETLDHLRGAGIAAFGGGHSLREAHAPLWIERQGLRIAVLGYNEFKPRSFEAGATWAGIAWSEEGQVVEAIRAARRAGAQVVIPFMHWGWEREPEPGERQWALARLMIDAGADAVVGGHPHVTQGAATYRGKPIVWSLGNFVFDGFELPAARVGWVLRMTVDRQGVASWDTVEARIDEAGTPHPAPQALTPCGRRGEPRVLACRPAP